VSRVPGDTFERHVGQSPGGCDRAGTDQLPFFYGWLLVEVSFVTMAIAINARTAYSLLFPQILDEFGWERGVTAGAFSFGFLVSAVVAPCVGCLIREPWQLYLTLGALVGGGGKPPRLRASRST